ncbi:hypothetical protein HRD49_06900 [Corallococcus exiguus]|uniref:hypothetical protein n=1 Tax=Corallococcus exiguus TaxID=83462 RepID=UPI001560642D|nr:hypothetical protein [Corallococcus exiguus]NRD61477.1 hypothetical protein [Corallococcus exiguus]
MAETDDKLEAIRARHAAATKGPWSWFGYLRTRDVGLHGRRMSSVMEFRRWGLNSAQPLFCTDGILRDLAEVATPDTSPERGRVTDINHPDARFIAGSWQDVKDLLGIVDALQAQVAQLTRERDEARRLHGKHILDGSKAIADLERERDNALDLLRSARATLALLGERHNISEHAYQELACHLDDEPCGADGERISTRAESEIAALRKSIDTAGHMLGSGEVAAAQQVLMRALSAPPASTKAEDRRKPCTCSDSGDHCRVAAGSVLGEGWRCDNPPKDKPTTPQQHGCPMGDVCPDCDEPEVSRG